MIRFRLFFLFFLASALSSAVASDRPNIVLIMADDIGIDGFGCYGGDRFATPRIDQLAAEGLRFTHAYAQPLCTPTRVELMTGKYNQRNWIAFGILDPRERTFGHMLKQAGYRTCIAGKWQLHSYDPPDFPNAQRRRGIGMKVSDAGFDEWSLFHSWNTEDKGSRYGNPTFDRNGEIVGPLEGNYGPDTSVAFLLDFMKRHRDSGDPMFLYYPMALPHWPMVPTPDSEEWREPSRRLEESTEYFPDMVAYMDKAVGRLIDGIAELGLREKTLVLFYSDNGTDKRITTSLNGEEFQGGKASPLQTGIRVPLIANWPGTIEPGRVSHELVDATDFFPTLAELGEATIDEEVRQPQSIAGKSFAPIFRGKDRQEIRDWAFFWYDPRPGWDKERYARHIFALDHRYKLFRDGRFFDIAGEGYREQPLDLENLGSEAAAARDRLRKVIDEMMKPPISEAAQVEVDAYGEPVTKSEK
ncbi:MAG: sulfatase-like hydrolase/transferase [Verrucomicrobiae bacterium]|nr:sulfatase-like hydrolase/transferase [Verrucomicrobiae bacterium]